jgi:hypothetical protein
LSAEELARLKYEVETRQANVDVVFGKLDEFVQRHSTEAGRESSIESALRTAEEKVVLLERLIGAMSKLNASYRDYVQALEKKVGF